MPQQPTNHPRDLCLPQLAEVSLLHGETQVPVLHDEALASACGVTLCFAGRRGGVSEGPYASLNISTGTDDDSARVHQNRHVLLAAAGAEAFEGELVVPEQVHGTHIAYVHSAEDAHAAHGAQADAVLCTVPGVPVLLSFADCVPVVIVAPGGTFAVVHSGWRGTLAGIAGMALAAVAEEAGCDAGSCNAYIGPHIGPCCYAVSPELLERFCARFGATAAAGEGRLDLEACVRASLQQAGCAAERIAASGICTACGTEWYFSHRAEHGHTGRQGACAYRKA